MRIPIIMGLPLHLWLGILLFLLIVFQILTAKKILPVPFKWHRRMGYVILILAILHGSMAVGLNIGTGSGAGPGASGTGDAAVPPGENIVIIEDYAYHPAEITIQSGETVTWINRDSVRHNAKGEAFDTDLLSKEEASSITFEEAGTFDYICTPHPYMEGTVIVE